MIWTYCSSLFPDELFRWLVHRLITAIYTHRASCVNLGSLRCGSEHDLLRGCADACEAVCQNLCFWVWMYTLWRASKPQRSLTSYQMSGIAALCDAHHSRSCSDAWYSTGYPVDEDDVLAEHGICFQALWTIPCYLICICAVLIFRICVVNLLILSVLARVLLLYER